MEPVLNLEDPRVLQHGVRLLAEFAKPSPKLLTANFGVAIATLLHRSSGSPMRRSGPAALVGSPDTSAPISTGLLQTAVCDATFEKDDLFLPAEAEGPIYKPFTDHFKGRSPRKNNWRNSFDLQAGLGCDAPYTADYLLSEAYLDEPRYYCQFRDPRTGHCFSPAGPGGTPTCFNPNKRDVPPGPETRAQHRPKLLSRGPEDNPGYWFVEPTVDALADLLARREKRVPLYPWMAAMYGGSSYFRQWGTDIARSRFEADLKLDRERFLTLFDPDPQASLNSEFLSNLGLEGHLDLGSADGEEADSTAPEGVAGQAMTRMLSAPVPFRTRDVDQLKARADASADPARRARLLERARKGHQRALEDLASLLVTRGDFDLTEQLDGYDLLARTEDVALLFEVKTWTAGNLAGQIRRGWAQLREYRYRNAGDLPDNVRLYLIFDRPPPADLWSWGFLAEDCGVIPAWMNGNELETFPPYADLLP